MADGHDTGQQEGASTGQGHNVRTISWITVGLLVVASIVLGFALPAHSLVLAIIGGVALVAGVFTALTGRIMDDAY